MNRMSPAGTLAATRNLIDLERGSDELLLVNSFYMRPLYVARGKERVRRVLSAAAPGLTLEGLTSACPGDVDLIRMLRDHRILIDTSGDKECYDQAEIEAAAAPRRLDRMTAYLLLTESCNLGCGASCRAGGRRLALRSGPPGQLGPGLLSRGDLARPGQDHCCGPPIGPPGPARQGEPLPVQ